MKTELLAENIHICSRIQQTQSEPVTVKHGSLSPPMFEHKIIIDQT